MNARTRTMASALIAAAALIASLAGCAGTAGPADQKAESSIRQDVAERRIWMHAGAVGPMSRSGASGCTPEPSVRMSRSGASG